MLPLFWPHLRLEALSTLRVSPQVAGLATRVTLDARTVWHGQPPARHSPH